MELPLATDLAGEPDLSHRVRDLHFFEESFLGNARRALPDGRYRVMTDGKKLRACFFSWLEAFHAGKHLAQVDRRDYVVYAAGRMFAELVRHDPVTVTRLTPHDADDVWPEGAIYASYCLSIALAVLEQDFETPVMLSTAAKDPRFWQSFRDNARDNPDFAIPFLDTLLGEAPNWREPAEPEKRAAMAAKAPTRLTRPR